jgi:hypothetical protein
MDADMVHLRSVSGVIAALLAVVLPVVLVAGVGWGVFTYNDAEERQAIENAGRVVNARVANGGDAAAAVDWLLSKHDPKVILIGPSYANTDVRPDIIAARLKIPRNDIALVSIPNSIGAHWYAVLKNRVFAQGYTPKLVVVVSGLQSMLLNTPLTESSFVNLQVHLAGSGDDPEIDKRVTENTQLKLARLREKRGQVRLAVTGLLRDVPARGFLGRKPWETRKALDHVFDDAMVDMSLHTEGTPIAINREVRAYDETMLPTPADSFMPVITDLVQANGSRMVWVRPPMSPDIPEDLEDVVVPGTQESAIAMLHEVSASFLDMRALPMSRDMFKNEDHMNEEGSRRFSEALGKALWDLDALREGAAADTVPPLELVAMEGMGALADLPQAERAWPGEGVWVFPGTALVLKFAEGWDPIRGPFLVQLVAEQLVGTTGVPTVEVGGAPVTLTPSDPSPRWRIWRARAMPKPPTEPFEIRVSVPPDGPHLRVSGVSMGERTGRTFFIGDEAAIDGARADLFGVFDLVDGVMVDHTVHPEFLNPVGGVPGANREVLDAPGRMARYDTHKWSFLSDEVLIGETNFGSRCSPLRITDQGRLLPFPNVPCVEVQRKGKGRSCHTPDSIYFTAADGTDPYRNGRTYKMVLDEGRSCDGAVWLYPKDHFTVRFPKDRLAVFRKGATSFTLGMRYLQQRKAEVQVRLIVDGEVRVDERLDGRDYKSAKPKTWKLDPPIPLDAENVELEIQNYEYTFYLINSATLSE